MSRTAVVEILLAELSFLLQKPVVTSTGLYHSSCSWLSGTVYMFVTHTSGSIGHVDQEFTVNTDQGIPQLAGHRPMDKELVTWRCDNSSKLEAWHKDEIRGAPRPFHHSHFQIELYFTKTSLKDAANELYDKRFISWKLFYFKFLDK